MEHIVTATEVRTRRLVISDDQDRPRIVAEVVEGVAEVRVETDDPDTHVLVYAGSRAGFGSEGLGVDVFVNGNSVARIHAWPEGQGWTWRVVGGT